MAAAGLASAFRSLRRSPGYTLLAAATLGLGLGAAAITLTLLDQVVLRRLEVEDEAGLVVAWGRHRTRDLAHFPYTWAAWDLIREASPGIVSVAATDAWGSSERLVDDGDRLVPVRWSRVLGDFFGVLGVAPVLGRRLTDADDIPGGPRLAVVSHGFWMRRWGGEQSVLGSTLTVDGQPYSVVGVMPPDLDYARGTEVRTPLRAQYADWTAGRPSLELDLVARLAAGSSREAVVAGIERVLNEDTDLAGRYSDVTPVIRPFADVVLGDLRQVILVLFAGGLLLLLVAGANVASLTAVRAAERHQALAIRLALGARRRDIAGGAAMEGLLVAGLGALLAVAFTEGGLAVLLPFVPSGIPRIESVAPDSNTWMGIAVLMALSGVMVAVVAGWRGRVGPSHMLLRDGSRHTGRRPASRAVLIVLQTGLALWTVAAAALLVRTLRNYSTLETGFDESGLYVVQLDHGYANFRLPDGLPSMLREAAQRVEATPGATGATPVLSPPLVGNSGFDIVPVLSSSDRDPAEALPYLSLDLVSPGYFETLRLPVLRGRALGAADRAGSSPSAVINEAAARALWPGMDPLGRTMILPFPGYEEIEWTVVGVAADSRYRELIDIRAAVYVPLDQMPVIAPRVLVIRIAGQLNPVAAVAAAFAEVDPSVRVVGATAVRVRMDAPLARPRFALAVLGAIAMLVLVLAIVGVYGVMAASVRGRTREIGVRMACGARPADAGVLILREVLLLAGLGAAGGIIASRLTGRFMESVLFGVSTGDPLTLLAAALIVLAAAVAACVPVALRAAATDPMAVLKEP